MLLSVAAEYNSSPLVKMLAIDEETGKLRISYVDSQDETSLRTLQEKLDEGVSFADFQIIKTTTSAGEDAYELRHFCTNIAPGEPDLEIEGLEISDPPSFVGFIRKLIFEGGNILLPLKNVPAQDIPRWMVAPANTVQFTEDMGIKISSLIPGQEDDHWRWTSSTILMAGTDDKFGDVTGHRFLCMDEFDAGEYAPYLVEHESVRVLQDNGGSMPYRVFSVTADLPIYVNKTNALVTPAIMSRLKFVADSYKLALYSLTQGLFGDRKIESSTSWERSAPLATGRFLKLKNSTSVSNKTASTMLSFLLESLRGQTTPTQEAEFLKSYPHYQVYASIIKSQTQTFFGGETTTQQKFRAYKLLKNVETYFYLLLQECRYAAMFNNDAYLFNLWTNNQSFSSDIPNYKVTISGGGGTWRPNVSYFW